MDPAVLDRNRMRSSGPDLADLFLKEAAETLQQLQQAADHGDSKGVREAAHRLKGSSGYLGADRLMEVSARIERAARAGESVAATEVRTVAAELTLVRDQLQALFSTAP
jgi:HPt (histidine-containing phosphotransfer) domain-containing protein